MFLFLKVFSHPLTRPFSLGFSCWVAPSPLPACWPCFLSFSLSASPPHDLLPDWPWDLEMFLIYINSLCFSMPNSEGWHIQTHPSAQQGQSILVALLHLALGHPMQIGPVSISVPGKKKLVKAEVTKKLYIYNLKFLLYLKTYSYLFIHQLVGIEARNYL